MWEVWPGSVRCVCVGNGRRVGRARAEGEQVGKNKPAIGLDRVGVQEVHSSFTQGGHAAPLGPRGGGERGTPRSGERGRRDRPELTASTVAAATLVAALAAALAAAAVRRSRRHRPHRRRRPVPSLNQVQRSLTHAR